MNLPIHYTKKQKQLQEVSSRWTEQIASFLPQDLDAFLKQSGCVKRFRGISDAVVLLKGIFLYAVSGLSFSVLSAAMEALQLSKISDTAWRKRFCALAPFLRLLLSSLLASFVSTPSPSRRVFLIDASIVWQQGKQGKPQRIHVSYSLNQNKMDQLYLTDCHVAESLSHFSMKPGDLFLADAGYGTIRNYMVARKQQADVILRFTPSHLVLYEKEGKRIDLLSFLPHVKEHSREGFGYVKHQNQLVPVRFVIAALPEEKAAHARERKRKKAIRNQHQIKASTTLYAGYVFLLTSLGVEYDREEILHLYQSRWQIELLFKRIKQNFQISKIRAGSEKYAESIVLVWMILWLIVERQQIQGELYLAKKKETLLMRISLWNFYQIQFQKMKEIVELSWSLFLEWEQEGSSAHLATHKRRRRNQNEEIHTQVLPSLME